MRDYSKVSGQFWTGKTGKSLRGDMQSQVVAMYLMTSPHSNMIGVFHCPPIYISHETGSTLEGAIKALHRLSEGGFCTYDDDSEMVWVHEMAKFQIGESLKPTDNRVKDIQKQYSNLAESRIKIEFFKKYGKAFCLTKNKPLESPFEAPPKPEAGTEAGTGTNTLTPFDQFWESYPKKIGKGAAEKSWKKVAEPLANILEAIATQKTWPEWVKDGGQFIPHPATWLNQKRWLDGVGTQVTTQFRKLNEQWEQHSPDHGWFPVHESEVPENLRGAA